MFEPIDVAPLPTKFEIFMLLPLAWLVIFFLKLR